MSVLFIVFMRNIPYCLLVCARHSLPITQRNTVTDAKNILTLLEFHSSSQTRLRKHYNHQQMVFALLFEVKAVHENSWPEITLPHTPKMQFIFIYMFRFSPPYEIYI